MNSPAWALVIFQVPSPLAKAMGMVFQPGVWRMRAMSVSPLALKSPDMMRTPGCAAQLVMNSPASPFVIFQVPSPFAKATGIAHHSPSS